MGNTVSGSRDRSYDEFVDFGSLTPQGIYTGPQDWNQQVVENLIVDRKLAPFYRPLEDYDDSWDDDQILAARKELPNSPQSNHSESSQGISSSKSHHGRSSNKNGKEPFRLSEASVYRGAVECPICFLYYPPNINRSRCCDQAICTECFIQIKRSEPTTTHLVSEPAACPYCVQENFGVTYQPPEWKAGLAREGQTSLPSPSRYESKASPSGGEQPRRRKSFGANDPEVVTVDHIRPDWEAKLAAVRAAVQRRANRRIIMRQVGDRLIPVGITSGRIVNIETPSEGGESENNGSPRRRRRHHPSADFNQLMGPDLEELMIMEAMRLSLIEHEEQQRRQNAADNNNDANANNANTNTIANDTRSELRAENSNNILSTVPTINNNNNNNIIYSGNVITPSSTPSPSASASPRNSLSPPNESSGHSTSPSPRQSFIRMSSPLGVPTPEQGSGSNLRRSTSSSRSAIIAALAAHTASAILGNENSDQSQAQTQTQTQTRQIEPDPRLADFPTTAGQSDSNTLENALADATNDSLDLHTHSSLEVRTDQSPSLPPLPPPTNDEGLITAQKNEPGLPTIPPLPERAISADDAAAERMPEGYVPLPSTTELSDPLIRH